MGMDDWKRPMWRKVHDRRLCLPQSSVHWFPSFHDHPTALSPLWHVGVRTPLVGDRSELELISGHGKLRPTDSIPSRGSISSAGRSR